jgi:hypothetical protein
LVWWRTFLLVQGNTRGLETGLKSGLQVMQVLLLLAEPRIGFLVEGAPGEQAFCCLGAKRVEIGVKRP